MRKKCSVLLMVVALGCFLPQSKAQVNLGSADSFAVLGATGVTSIGSTVLNGNLGEYPGTTISGFGPGIVNGSTYYGGPVAMQAQSDALSAYNTITGLTPTLNLSGATLGTGGTVLTLTSGVYSFSSSVSLDGALTLSGPGDFIFQIGTTFTTADAASIILAGGASAANVFWEVGTSATLGANNSFDGSIIATNNITLGDATSVDGRAIALSGAVNLDDNYICVPAPVPDALEPGTLVAGILLMQFGARKFGLRVLRRKNAT
jgi:hypothetical protein